MATPQQIAERLNDWTGQDTTEDEVRSLIWALAMDCDLKADLDKAVFRMKCKLEAEMAACI